MDTYKLATRVPDSDYNHLGNAAQQYVLLSKIRLTPVSGNVLEYQQKRRRALRPHYGIDDTKRFCPTPHNQRSYTRCCNSVVIMQLQETVGPCASDVYLRQPFAVSRETEKHTILHPSRQYFSDLRSPCSGLPPSQPDTKIVLVFPADLTLIHKTRPRASKNMDTTIDSARHGRCSLARVLLGVVTGDVYYICAVASSIVCWPRLDRRSAAE